MISCYKRGGFSWRGGPSEPPLFMEVTSMITNVVRLLIGALRRWTARLLALTTSRLNVLLIGGMVVVGVLALGLVYHALSGNGQGQEQTMRLLTAYDKNWLIALAFF